MKPDFQLTFTDTNLPNIQAAVKASRSIRNTLLTLGLAGQGGNYRIFHRYVKKHNIDISHFTGAAHNRGTKGTDRYHGSSTTLETMMNNPHIQSYKLKRRLLKDGIFAHMCSVCNLVEWNGQPIPLELDHIDGQHANNQLDNLRMLCPNCHAQTPTYRGKNKGKSK